MMTTIGQQTMGFTMAICGIPHDFRKPQAPAEGVATAAFSGLASQDHGDHGHVQTLGRSTMGIQKKSNVDIRIELGTSSKSGKFHNNTYKTKLQKNGKLIHKIVHLHFVKKKNMGAYALGSSLRSVPLGYWDHHSLGLHESCLKYSKLDSWKNLCLDKQWVIYIYSIIECTYTYIFGII